jgi:hypothetical protein
VPQEPKLELVPVAVEVARVGALTFPATEFTHPAPGPEVVPGRDRDSRPATTGRRRVPRKAVFAAVLVTLAAAGVIASIVLDDDGSRPETRRADARASRAVLPTRKAALPTLKAAVPTRKAAPAVSTDRVRPSPSESQPSAGAAVVPNPAQQPAPPRPATTARGLAPPLAHSAPRASSQPRPLPESGYVSGRSHLFVSGNGRAVTQFVVVSRCAPEASLPSIPIRPDGTFRYAGRMSSKDPTKVTIRGRFVSREVAKVQLRFLAAGCDSGVIAMTLRLS